MRVKEQVRSPVRSPVGGSPGLTLPSWIKHLWTFKQGINSKKGPDLSFLYPTGTLPDFAGGVRASTIPPIDPAKGWFGGPGYTNLFTTASSGAAVISLTAQNYCLQCVGGSVVAGAYGTATPSTPLIFTASAGNTTFTPTGVTAWQLTASGGYVFPVIPHNTTVVSTASGATYYAGWPMDYNTKAGQEMLECLRGVPDGTEVWSDATASGTNWAKTGSTWTHTAGNTAALADAGKVTVGQRYLAHYTVARTAGSVVAKAGSTGTGGATIAASGTYNEELTCVGSTDLLFVPSSDFSGSVTVISIQKLNPAVFTLMDQTYMGVGSGELISNSNIITPSANGYAISIQPVNIIVSGSDQTNNPYKGYSWVAGKSHRRILQTKTDSSQFRVGYQILGVNETIQWSSWVTFDSSMNPLAILKMFYANTTPNYKQLVALSNKSLSDAEIAKVFNYAN